VLKLHNCTVDVKVMALLSADVMTAVRKTVRRERRPMSAIGPFAVDLRRPGVPVYSPGKPRLPASEARGAEQACAMTGTTMYSARSTTSAEMRSDRPRDVQGLSEFAG